MSALTGVALTVLSVAVDALLVLVGALWLAWRAERHAADEAEATRDEAVNEARAAGRLHRAEVQELTVELSTARAELHARRRLDDADTATPTPDDLPALDSTTLRQVWACSPADFDTPGDAR